MRSSKQPLPTTTTVWGIALLAAIALTAPAAAQDIFPPNEPREIYSEDVNGAVVDALPGGISQYNYQVSDPLPVLGTSNSNVSCGNGFWATHLIQTEGLAGKQSPSINRAFAPGRDGVSSVFVVDQSVAGNGGWVPTDWDNFRFEFDFWGDPNAAVGVVWGGTDVDNDHEVDHGYLFYIDRLPTQLQVLAGENAARWTLVKRQSKHDLVIDSGYAVLDPGNNDLLSVFAQQCYRMRVEFFCGTLRVSVARIDCGASDCTVTQCGGGSTTCSPEDYSSCAPAEIDWCTLLDWIEPEAVLNGFVGIFAGGADIDTDGGGPDTAVPGTSRFDNLVSSTWDYDCSVICPASGVDPYGWSAWTDDWDPAATGEGVEDIELKYLYTGSLIDFQYGYLFKPQGRYIDVTATNGPTTVTLLDGTSEVRNNCGGWTVLHSNQEKPIVDLPPHSTNDSNLSEMLAYLEPMSSAVRLVYDTAGTVCPAGSTTCFVDDFDNVKEISGSPNPNYNPMPLPTRGATPIRASLEDAYDWYVYQRSDPTSEWHDDPLSDCRLWYVIFITDGEESCCENDNCGDNNANLRYDWACETGGPAQAFASPEALDGTALEPVKVYTVGFSESVAADSPLQCVADITGGRFFSATDASGLVDVLYDVLDDMQETDRSFIPYSVTPPPPSTAGSVSTEEQFLAVFPHFIPRNQQTVWDGDLLAFAFNQGLTGLPMTDQCAIDTGQAAWTLLGSPAGANEILEAQITSSTRNVFLSSGSTRYPLQDVFTNATLRADFKSMLGGSSLPSDLETVEVVNFVRNIYANPGGLSLSPAPVNPPRPNNYHALGDIYHSQPQVVNPPNNYMYFSDYGLGPANDYLSFRTKHAKRRRIVIAGANDGQIHAFDGGFFDRTENALFDDRHDLGNGIELFSWVPQAVMDRLHRMTYGTEHQYMADGTITTGDAFIDHDGDSTAEWRTVALAPMRRGGRGLTALDITTPDPILEANDWTPPVSTFPGCLNGSASGCDAVYPHLLWEFSDTLDADGNCPSGFTGAQCEPYWDLGWTWSEPVIARIAVYAEDGSGNQVPEDTYVAFFGGGWDPDNLDRTGLHFYGVEIETGATVVKELIGVSVPGSPTVLDSDADGFHDRIYFGDSNGKIYRLQYPTPFGVDGADATGADAGILRTIFDGSGALTTTYGRQFFFSAPTIVPVLFDGSGYTYALVMGAGDRANLGDETDGITNHFFAVLDDFAVDSTTASVAPYTVDNLVARDYTDLVNTYEPEPGATVCTDSAFADPNKGWYITLRDGTEALVPAGSEKVNYQATVFAGHVFFTTFQPGEGLTASNPPAVCVPSTPPPTGTPTPEPTATPDTGIPDPNDTRPVCKAAGIGRLYDVGMTCGLGEYTEVNEILTGITVYTIGPHVHIVATTSAGVGDDGGTNPGNLEKTFDYAVTSSTTNWRQE